MIALIIVIAIVVILAIVYISLHNNIVRMDNRCDNAWQTIDTQLQRRNDLIPNLVETVKGYAKHESGTLEAVTQARSMIQTATTPEAKMEASNVLTGALRSLFAVAEAYPDLKANENFQQLQEDLTDTENKISYARQSFNDCVLEYNSIVHPEFGLDTLYIDPYDHQASLYGGWWSAVPNNTAVNGRICTTRDNLTALRETAARVLGFESASAARETEDVPKPFADFLRSAPLSNAYEDFAYWDDVLIKSYGERRFINMEKMEN